MFRSACIFFRRFFLDLTHIVVTVEYFCALQEDDQRRRWRRCGGRPRRRPAAPLAAALRVHRRHRPVRPFDGRGRPCAEPARPVPAGSATKSRQELGTAVPRLEVGGGRWYLQVEDPGPVRVSRRPPGRRPRQSYPDAVVHPSHAVHRGKSRSVCSNLPRPRIFTKCFRASRQINSRNVKYLGATTDLFPARRSNLYGNRSRRLKRNLNCVQNRFR